MILNIRDRVTHVHYPNTQGVVIEVSGPVVVVLWDENKAPGNVDNSCYDLPKRVSRHIPHALCLV